MSREVADHLQYFADIGVTGVSRDPKWRTRGDNSPGASGFSRIVAGDTPTILATESLDEIKTDIGAACTRCKLCTLGRSQIVFGTGNAKARLMFVGEAPGQEEDE